VNDELQKALAEFVKATLAGFQQGKDFVLAQAPDVIQQLIRWTFWEAVAWALFSLAIAVAAAYAIKRLTPIAKEAFQDSFPNPFPFLGIAFALIVVAFAASAAVSHVLIAMKVYIAPKVWLLEWAMQQIK
jgi:H+/Cl- antiporter ClcA